MRFLMLKRHNLLPYLLLPVLMGTAAIAPASPRIYRGLDDKPADPGYSYTKAVFDCQPPDSLTVTVGLVTTLADSTIGRDELIDSYPCAPWNELGPEMIYRLEVAADLELKVVMTGTEPEVDLDLFLFNDCDSDSCLVGANTEFRLDLAAGTYFLIVDTTAPLDTSTTAGTFTLNLEARPLGVPESVCEPGGAQPVVCAGESITIADEDLFPAPDLIDIYDCGPSPRTSGELWYVITLPGTHEVTAVVRDVAPNLDVNLWLFDGCGPDAQCLQYVDDNLADSGESLTWVNELESPLTAYLAVDAVRPQAEAGLGQYTIDFQCQTNVASEGTSFGSLKGLYR